MHKYFLVLWFLTCFKVLLIGGEHEKLDSLKSLSFERMTVDQKLDTYNSIIRESINDEDSTIKYAELMLEVADKDKHTLFYCRALSYLGQSHLARGEYQEALSFMLAIMNYYEDLPARTRAFTSAIVGKLYNRLGEVESMRLNYINSVNAYSEGTTTVDSIGASIELNNMADGFLEHQYLDSAIKYYEKAQFFAELLGLDVFVKMIEGSEGIVYSKLGNYDEAIPRLEAAIDATEGTRQTISLIAYKQELGAIFLKQGKFLEAENHLLESLELSEDNGLKEHIRDVSELLSLLYEKKGLYEASLGYYRQFQIYKDSIENIESVKNMANMRKEYEVGQKQAELDLVNAERDKERLITIGISLLAAVLLILGLVILKYYRQKEKTNKELERLNQTKDKFFSIISHDLRGPVSSFFGISRMIKSLVNRQQTEQLLAIADDIDESVDRLSALLDNLLNWAMQQQGHFPNVPEKVDLNEVAEDLIRTLDTMAKGKQIDLQGQIEQPIHLWVDKNTTMTILRNLVNNALKFTSDGGSVTIAASKNADQAVIEVIDSGVGISQEKLKNLFQLQDKKSTYGTSGEKGLGLGLQLVYEFVEMNGGKIEVSSQELVGTTFTVILPLYDLEEEVIVT